MEYKKCYEYTLDGEDGEQAAMDHARDMVWSEIEHETSNIAYARYIDTVNGINVYYDFGADYYFFTDET